MAVRDRRRGTGVASAEYLPGTRLVRYPGFDPVAAGDWPWHANSTAELRKALK
jgi:hypothetical protein